MIRVLSSILVLVLLSCAIGCDRSPSRNSSLPPEPAGAGRAIRDDLGNVVVVPERITRAVSLAPNLTEIIYAIGAGETLVGVTTYCDFPEDAKRVAKIGDTMKPNIETIIALKPDIVFVSTASQLETFTKTLGDQKISVVVSNPNSLDGIYKSIEMIGEVYRTPRAAELIASMKNRVSTIENRVKDAPQPTVFVQLDGSLYTIGRGSYLTDLISRAGGVSATGQLENAYLQLSKESALALDPEIIILSDSPDNPRPSDAFRNSRATRDSRVFRINADIMSRPGPRVVDALEKIAAVLHPELFKQ